MTAEVAFEINLHLNHVQAGYYPYKLFPKVAKLRLLVHNFMKSTNIGQHNCSSNTRTTKTSFIIVTQGGAKADSSPVA